MKIRAVTPITTESFGPMIIEEFVRVARPDTEISNVFLDDGPASVESFYDEAIAVPGVVAKGVPRSACMRTLGRLSATAHHDEPGSSRAPSGAAIDGRHCLSSPQSHHIGGIMRASRLYLPHIMCSFEQNNCQDSPRRMS